MDYSLLGNNVLKDHRCPTLLAEVCEWVGILTSTAMTP
jgi:hypothetical protein